MTPPTVAALQKVALRTFRDPRGVLVPLELAETVPFPVARAFWVGDVPLGTERGGHAHKACHQFLVCVAGAVAVTVYDGTAERTIPLAAAEAVHVPPGIFAAERYDAPGSLLMVFCDRPYDPADYLPNRAAFIEYRRQAAG